MLSVEPDAPTTNTGQQDIGEVFTTGEIASFTGASQNEVDYWVQCKLITPSIRLASGQGSRRLFNRNDLRDALLVQRLRIALWKPKQIMSAFTAIKKVFQNPDALNTPLLIHEGSALLILCRDKQREPILLDASSPDQSVMVIALETLEEETRLRLARNK